MKKESRLRLNWIMFGQIFDDLVPISFLEENSFLSGMLDTGSGPQIESEHLTPKGVTDICEERAFL